MSKGFLPLLGVLLLALPALLRAQLDMQTLEQSVQNNQCEAIAAALDTTPLVGETMCFQGAVCFFRNGNVGRALKLFGDVRKMGGPKQYLAGFWAAKCHAVLGQDSAAMAILSGLPRTSLTERMLGQPEFDGLAQRNPQFSQLRRSVAPSFNICTGLLAGITVLGFLLTAMLWFGRSKFSKGGRWLSIVVAAFSITLASYVLYWTRYVGRFPYIGNLWPFLTLLVGPSLYFYLKTVFAEKITALDSVRHYTIPTIAGLLTLPVFLSDLRLIAVPHPDIHAIGSAPVLLTGHLLYYAIQIHSTTQNDWQVDHNIKVWTRIVSTGMQLYTVAFFSYYILVQCSFFNPAWDYAISFVMALGIIGIAYMGLLQKRVFRSEPIERFLPTPKYQTSALTTNASASIRQKMERLLAEQEVFKENELRLDDLAAYLDVSRHHLSQVINEHYGVNFFEFINRYRIAHVKKLLSDPRYDHYTLLQIAYEAGFNNKASFNRCFRAETGLTPSEYRLQER